MHIQCIEIANFRKLLSIHVGFSPDKTVFVGANNSGKTSAMVALRYFLIESEAFSLHDFTLSHWPEINKMGAEWETANTTDQPLPEPVWDCLLPTLDVWLKVKDTEIHYVQKILPTLDWEGDCLGVRFRFEPKDSSELQEEYIAARTNAVTRQAGGTTTGDNTDGEEPATSDVYLWPHTLTDFLKRRLAGLFVVKAYVLDPDKFEEPLHGLARPQLLAANSEPLAGDPFKGLIRIDEISAQRGFSDYEKAKGLHDEDGPGTTGKQKLSRQLRQYYNRHLDPYENPNAQDLQALKAIEEAQKAFDGRLNAGFKSAFTEMEMLGYPGITDPKLNISTRLRPIDGLKHDAALQYAIPMTIDDVATEMCLPEDSNGLGYQNLISMVFRLMSFRDAWMRVGKAHSKADASDGTIPPLHLVLIEEPEAHLHTQVQQVFIRQAYKILRGHDKLSSANSFFATQLVVSTHSSHIAHECDFESLRYFRRMPGDADHIPTSRVVNLTKVFGPDKDTKRFVSRYLKVTHCDLFFADAAIFIEGPAERLLVPLFVASHPEFRVLSECYITWLEIGGSHAHRLRGLVETLGLTTLIITDLDAMDSNLKSVRPARNANLTSRNETLKTWCPGTADLDDLLSKTNIEKTKVYSDECFAICVAYQSPVTLPEGNKFSGEALANTLEDALVFENIEAFKSLDTKGLASKFKTAVETSQNITDLGIQLSTSLSTGNGKAELALDLLEIEDSKALRPPTYIKEGLLWLSGQVRKCQLDLGLAMPDTIPPVPTTEEI